jgi:pimeloyl-ACP methyl ester carboxylesterase
MRAEHETIRYDAAGLDVTAHAWGERGAPLALLLHGYPDTGWTWRHLGPHLAARGFRAVAPFMRGYAPTALAPDGGYQIGALVRDTVAAHEVLGGDGRAVLVGHDWGAATAYATDAFAPGLFRRVVTLAVPPGPVLLAQLRSPAHMLRNAALIPRQLRRSWYMGFQQLPLSERALSHVIPKLWRDWSPGYDATEDVAQVLRALEGPGRRTAALRYYRALLQPWERRAGYAAEASHELGLGPATTLYLHGEDDGCMLSELARRAGDIVETKIVPGVGHFLHLEEPERVNELIGGFLAIEAA